MTRFDDRYYEQLGAAIADSEAQTSAEIVVVVEPFSGSYRDVDVAVGAGLAYAGLLAILFGPWPHPEWAVAVDMLVLFGLGAWLSSGMPAVRRGLTGRRRRRAQVERAAAAAFAAEDVTMTRDRTGLLVYYSVLEREVVLRADRGVAAAVPEALWDEIEAPFRLAASSGDPAAALLEACRGLGPALSPALPPGADNPDELPNAPRHRIGSAGQPGGGRAGRRSNGA